MKKPAIDVEEDLLEEFVLNREVDRLLGGSRAGCHKTDIMVKNIDNNLSAELCSSGEQKSLLISLVIAAATAFMEYSKKSPIILLDEVFFTHLDLSKKSSLLEKLVELNSQIWITATENENFFKIKKFLLSSFNKNGIKNVY